VLYDNDDVDDDDDDDDDTQHCHTKTIPLYDSVMSTDLRQCSNSEGFWFNDVGRFNSALCECYMTVLFNGVTRQCYISEIHLQGVPSRRVI